MIQASTIENYLAQMGWTVDKLSEDHWFSNDTSWPFHIRLDGPYLRVYGQVIEIPAVGTEALLRQLLIFNHRYILGKFTLQDKGDGSLQVLLESNYPTEDLDFSEFQKALMSIQEIYEETHDLIRGELDSILGHSKQPG